MDKIAELLKKVMGLVPTAVALAPEFVELVQEVGKLTTVRNQQELQTLLAKVQKDNDEGFVRLDEKLK